MGNFGTSTRARERELGAACPGLAERFVGQTNFRYAREFCHKYRAWAWLLTGRDGFTGLPGWYLPGRLDETGYHPSDYANRTPRDEEAKDVKGAKSSDKRLTSGLRSRGEVFDLIATMLGIFADGSKGGRFPAPESPCKP
ncbi:MAG: hypothetical protein HIU93_01130 [Acidobacteria bacterium]|nr:hypothetical protein [Acidobacteriota bacterium]MBW4044099.1 hypothetical protein [Acidobacteriota bacterium]